MADPTQPSDFLKNLVGYLEPHFDLYKYDEPDRRTEILQTLVATGARTRLEYLFAGLTIAFGFAALETLADAKADQRVTPPQTIRYRTVAATLNRACQQNAKALAASLACDQPTSPTARKPAKSAPTPPPEPVNDLSDAEALQILAQAKTTLDTCRNRLAQPTTEIPVQSRNNPLAHLFAPTPQA